MTDEQKPDHAFARSLSNVGLEAATHLLQCSHCRGRSTTYYKMRCAVLGETKSGKVKIRVFGERNWAGRDHVSRIRYVDSWRLTEASNVEFSGDAPLHGAASAGTEGSTP